MAKLEKILAEAFREIAELKRRLANLNRTGVVAEADYGAGRYRVKLKAAGDDGGPVLTGWLPLRSPAMGSIKIDAPLKIGEQVTLSSESGDLSDAVITGSLPSNAEGRPNDKPAELTITIGTTRLHLTETEATITTDASFIHMTPSKITAQAADIEFLVTGGEFNINEA